MSREMKVLIVDDEIEYQDVMEIILGQRGYYIKTASSGEEALELLKQKKFDLVLTDLQMNGMDGISLLGKVKELYEGIFVILITGYGTIKNAVEAMKLGAYSYFVKGNDPGELIKEIEKIEDIIFKNSKEEFDIILEPSDMSKNAKVINLYEIARKAAKSNVNILITGESGTGKEVMARFIHKNSNRIEENFVAVNCQAFSSGLLESELFGHEKGAFTGAVSSRSGRFEEANKGTLFLDEIGDIDLNTQVKLLRVLENRYIERIGSNKQIEIDFRLISATNKDLDKDIITEKFREDLFYRINTIRLHLVPLRERKEDLIMFIEHFISQSSRKYNKEITKFEDGVIDILINYDYPGNIRELKNIIDRLVVLSQDGEILKKYIGIDIDSKHNENNSVNNSGNEEYLEDIKPLKEVKKEAEAKYIKRVLNKFNGNITKAAEHLGISRRQLFNKINEYEI